MQHRHSRTNPERNPGTIDKSKQRLRRQLVACRRQMSPEERSRKSRRIRQRLFDFAPFHRARRIHSYVSMPEEVDTHGIVEAVLAERGVISVPRVRPGTPILEHYDIHHISDLVRGTFGILEPDPSRCTPTPIEQIELVIVPGCAFDRRGNRLGYGKGYYDRFLAKIPALRIGLAFACQIVERVPTHHLDVPMDVIITEDEWILTGVRDLPELTGLKPESRR